MTVEVRTRKPSLFVPALLPSCAGATRAQKERALAASGNGTAGSASPSGDAQHKTPVARNSRYTICRNGVLLLSLPLSPEPNEKVIMRPTGFIALQFPGSQTKNNRQTDSSFLLSVCNALFSRSGTSCRGNRRLGNFRSDRVVANDKTQNPNLRQHFIVVVILRANLPVVAGFAKDGI
jgi:hypothetical protein